MIRSKDQKFDLYPRMKPSEMLALMLNRQGEKSGPNMRGMKVLGFCLTLAGGLISLNLLTRAGIAQLVECQLPKLDVAGSNP